MSAIVEIDEFTDPACTWCWGSEPQLRKLEYLFGDRIKLGFIMGGLVEDAGTFMDPRNRIGGDLEQFNKQVATHWVEASGKHGMPVQVEGFQLFTDTYRSTYPMNIAYKAAQFQGEAIAKRFLRRMREAIATEARQANQLGVLIELAGDAGLDTDTFARQMCDGSAEKSFKQDQELTRSYGVRGYPSYRLTNQAGDEAIVRGYRPYEDFIELIGQLSEEKLVPAATSADEEHILDFMGNYARVAPKELQVVFDMDPVQTEEIMAELVGRGTVTETRAGNGVLYSLASPVSG